MLDIICLADQIKPHLAERHAVTAPSLFSELDAVIRRFGVDLVRNGFERGFKKLAIRLAIDMRDQLRESKLANSVSGLKEIKLSLRCLDFGDVDRKIANRVAFEILPLRLFTFGLWQTGSPMPPQTTMQ